MLINKSVKSGLPIKCNNLHPRNRFTSRFRGFVVWLAQKRHHFSASPTPKPPAVNLTFRSTEKHHSYAVYKLTYRLGYSIIILIRVCLKSDRQKISDTKSCKRKDDTVDIRRFIFSVLLYGSVLYSIFHLP